MPSILAINMSYIYLLDNKACPIDIGNTTNAPIKDTFHTESILFIFLLINIKIIKHKEYLII